MNSTMLDLGLFQIKWYSFFILVAMLTACLIIYREAIKKGLPREKLEDLLFYGILFGILGARIYYVLFNLNSYLANPLEMIQIWHGGLAIHGGIIAGFLWILYYSKKEKINFWQMLDVIVVGLILAQAIGRWGNFFNGEAYGRIVSEGFLKKLLLPNFIIQGMYINGAYREPTFLYESILSLIGFIVLIKIRKMPNLKIGQLCGTYLIWYGIERFVVETFRSDSLLLFGFLKMAKVVSILFIGAGIYLIVMNIKNNRLYKEERLLFKKLEEVKVCTKK